MTTVRSRSVVSLAASARQRDRAVPELEGEIARDAIETALSGRRGGDRRRIAGRVS